MISEDILEDIAVAVKETMKLERVNGYDYQIENKSECGENYMTEVFFVRVDPEENAENSYNLVIKTAKRSKEIRDKYKVYLLYNRELFMYSTVFPNFRKFIEEANPKFKFDFVPNMYWAYGLNNRETIVLENLKKIGFELHDRKKPWKLEQTVLAIKRYGTFHALSMALKDQKPQLFEVLKKDLQPLSPGMIENIDVRKCYEEPFEHIMNLLRKNGRNDLADKYYVLLDEVEDLFNCRTEDEDRVAICHMDCWNNNYMFKYESEGDSKPSDIRFVDFQLCIIDSPVKDLSYNIYATCDNTCLEHFDQLLQTYHESLRQSVESLGSNPEQCLSMKDLRRHWRKYGIHGLFLAITMIKMELMDKDDALSIEEMAKHENVFDGFNVKVKEDDQEEYDRRILEVFLHFGDNFL